MRVEWLDNSENRANVTRRRWPEKEPLEEGRGPSAGPFVRISERVNLVISAFTSADLWVKIEHNGEQHVEQD